MMKMSILSVLFFLACFGFELESNENTIENYDGKCRIEYSEGTGRFIKVTGDTCKEAREKLEELLKE